MYEYVHTLRNYETPGSCPLKPYLVREKFQRGLTPLEPQSRFGDKVLEIQVVRPHIYGTTVLKGLIHTT